VKWYEVERLIPPCFRDNGPSSPFGFLYGFIYTPKRRAAIYRAAKVHDFLYWQGRLSGSGTEHLTRSEADFIYGDSIRVAGYPVIAKLHAGVLRRFGGRAYDKAMRRMRALCDYTYGDYLSRKLHEGNLSTSEFRRLTDEITARFSRL
jgi:hypothetical protein